MAPKKADKKPAAKTTKPAAEKKKTKKKAKARDANAARARAAPPRRTPWLSRMPRLWMPRCRRVGRLNTRAGAPSHPPPQVESYKIYIYKVLKQVHPDTGISSKAMSIMRVCSALLPPHAP